MKYFEEKAGARSTGFIVDDEGQARVINSQEGMALIDWFAGQTITGIVESSETSKRIAEWAYDYAKAMMDERARLMEELDVSKD